LEVGLCERDKWQGPTFFRALNLDRSPLAVRLNPPATPNAARVYLDRLTSPASRRVMGATLAEIARMLSGGSRDIDEVPWASLRYRQASGLRALLIEQQRAPATANRFIAALRGVLREAWRLGQMTAEDYQQAADISLVTGSRLPRGRRLTRDEVEKLFACCAYDKTPAGVRDAAILAVLVGCGLRRSEAAGLDVSDYEHVTGEVRVRVGKGRKERVAYALGGIAAALDDWLVVRGIAPGRLFVPVRRGGHLELRGMTDQAIYAALDRRRVAAGGRRFSPHDLRRTFITDLLDAGVDLAMVQRLAGHASLTTTARYDHRGEAAKRRAAAMLVVPYKRCKAAS
jgi:integrase